MPTPIRSGGLAMLALVAAAVAGAAPAAAQGQRDDVYVDDKPDPLAPLLVRERIETEYNNIFIVQKGDFLSMTFRLKGENTRQSALNLRDRIGRLIDGDRDGIEGGAVTASITKAGSGVLLAKGK